MSIRTESLVLRKGTQADIAQLVPAIGDRVVAEQLAHVPWPYTEQDAVKFIARMQTGELPRFLVFQQSENGEVLVGGCGASSKDGHVTIGYWVRHSHWGRGIATEAVAALLVQLAGDGHEDVFAEHKPENLGSAKVLAKLGFDEIEPTDKLMKLPEKSEPFLILRHKRLKP